MKESYDGRDISGRYWYATTWTLIDGSWKMLMEQEIPLDASHKPAERSSGGDDSKSLIGTWRLVVADYRPDKNSRWKHSYGEHPKGYLIYDETGHVSIQVSNDPPTPPFKARDDYKPTAREAETAYINYVAYFGTYSVDPVRHVVTHHVEGSLLPSYTSTDQERPYQLDGDTLELSDRETWRAVWVRVPAPGSR